MVFYFTNSGQKQSQKSVSKFWTFFAVIFLISACTTSNLVSEGSPNGKLSKEHSIVFYSLKIFRDDVNGIQGKLDEVRIVPGSLKNHGDDEGIARAGDLFCNILDSKNNIRRTFYLKNPLQPDLEYVNEDYKLETKFVDLKEANVFIRTCYDSDFSKLEILEADSLKKLNHLFTINL